MNKLKQTRLLVLLVAVTAVAVFVAACGGSSSSGAKDASAATNSRTAFTSCLKSHGVTLPSGAGKFRGKFKHGAGGGGFPGTGSSSGGSSGAPGTGSSSGGSSGAPGTGAPTGGYGGGFAGGGTSHFGNSKFAKAMKDCESKLPASERGKFGHGGFGGKRPSAKFKPHFNTATLDKFVSCIRKNGYAAMPEPKKNSTSGAFFPKSVESNPDFKKALPKCESVLRSAYGPSGASSTTTSASSS